MFKRRLNQKILELATRIDDLDRKLNSLQLDLDLYVSRLRASRGLGKFKSEEKEKKDLKDNVLLSDDGNIP